MLAAADVGVADVQLGDHLADDVGQVGAVRSTVGDERRRTGRLHRLPVDAVHLLVVEEVAHLPPALAVDLLPLRRP